MTKAISARRSRARRNTGQAHGGTPVCAWLFLAFPVLAGCEGVQSALAPASAEAHSIANLFWIMTAGAGVIWLAVIGLAVHATITHPERHPTRYAHMLIVIGGAVVPVVVLGALLAYGLSLMPKLRPALPGDALRIAVSGEQWWWRVRYHLPGGDSVVLANEIRLPVGQSAEFLLSSPDVVHSFWIPSLGGKTDMMPGRETRLVLTPTKTGVYRGACAEYCGVSHARMNFAVVVMEPAAFSKWIDHQATPARAPKKDIARRGRDAFLANGCGACHTVRGTPANGEVGPDLTHVAGRLTLAAGVLPVTPETLLEWIDHPQQVKPGAYMPAFDMLPLAERHAIAAYLGTLE